MPKTNRFAGFFLRLSIILLFVGILTSCGPAAKLRRAEKLIKRAEAQGAVWHEQVTKTDTVIVTKSKVDTLLKVTKLTDTLFVDNIRLIVQNDTITNTVTIQGKREMKTDTLWRTQTVTRTIIAPDTKKVAGWYRTGFWILAVLVLIVVTLKIVFK